MTPRTFSWQFVAVGAVAALALSACGGSDSTDTGSTTAPTSAAAAKGDGELKIGTLLPQTGSLAFLGPPEFAGVGLAIKDINAAGGVLGKPVTETKADSGDTSTDIASSSVDRLLSQKVDTIIGAASSGVSLTVIDKITGAAWWRSPRPTRRRRSPTTRTTVCTSGPPRPTCCRAGSSVT